MIFAALAFEKSLKMLQKSYAKKHKCQIGEFILVFMRLVTNVLLQSIFQLPVSMHFDSWARLAFSLSPGVCNFNANTSTIYKETKKTLYISGVDIRIQSYSLMENKGIQNHQQGAFETRLKELQILFFIFQTILNPQVLLQVILMFQLMSKLTAKPKLTNILPF
jgi:hypothetical protein